MNSGVKPNKEEGTVGNPVEILQMIYPKTLEEVKRVLTRIQKLNPVWEFPLSSESGGTNISKMTYESPDSILVTVEIWHRKEIWNRKELEYGYNKGIISIYKIEGKDHLQLYWNSFPGYPENEAYEYLVKYYVNASVERQKKKGAETAAKNEKSRAGFLGQMNHRRRRPASESIFLLPYLSQYLVTAQGETHERQKWKWEWPHSR